MSDEELEKRSEVAKDVAQAASEHPPDSGTWGIYTYGDGPGGIGGGVGSFLWFESDTALFEFVSTHLAHFAPVPITSRVEPILAEVHTIIEGLKHHELEQEPARLTLNTALRG